MTRGADRRRLRAPLSTFLLSMALAATLATTVYLAVTSLPYLALTPTTDPVFGVLNECLRGAVPERVGFAVSSDASQAAAWSTGVLARCHADGGLEAWPISGLTLGAFDGAGRLWTARRLADGGAPQLLAFDGPASRVIGDVHPEALVGTASGVVALEPPGRLVALTADGAVLALRDLPEVRGGLLTASADGSEVALVAGGGFSIFDAATLAIVRSEAPCQVEFLWWQRDGHRATLSCAPGSSWALSLDADTGAQEALPQKARARSVLAGSSGVWVQPCDGLPCSAPPP